MLNDNKQLLDIYKINTKLKLDKKKILLIILIFIALITCILLGKQIAQIIDSYKVYKQYEAQLDSINYQKKLEEEKKLAEEERKRQEKIPKLTEQGKQNIEKIYTSETKRAFLTFDDGPSIVTPTILDILKQENVKATFFVLGSNVEKMPDTVKRIYEEGHYIANHGYSHVYSKIYSSPQAVLDEYNLCNNLVKNAIGESEYNSHLFRFPGGLVRRRICPNKT